MLLKNGADVNSKNKLGYTSLGFAVSQGHEKIAKMLLKNGADVNSKNENGDTSLTKAVSEGHEKIAEMLLKNGADVNSKNENGDTSLTKAVSEGHEKIAEMLLKNGADVNSKNKYGDTSLKTAVREGHEKIVEILLKYGANPFISNIYCRKKSCEQLITKYQWKYINNNVNKLAKQFSKSGDIRLPYDVWRIILLNKKQQQLCKNLSSERNIELLIEFADMLGIPISEGMTKAKLCGIISRQLTFGKYEETEKQMGVDKKQLEIHERGIKELAAKFGINTNRNLDEVVRDLAKMF